MKTTKTFLIIIVALLTAFLINFSVSAQEEEDHSNYQTYKMGKVSLRVNTPLQWEPEVSKSGDIYFFHKDKQDEIMIQLANLAGKYKSEQERNETIELAQKGILEEITKSEQQNGGQGPENITKGVENIEGIDISWTMFTVKSKGQKAYFKLLFPYSKEKIFMIMVMYTDKAPFDDAEYLMDQIIKAIVSYKD